MQDRTDEARRAYLKLPDATIAEHRTAWARAEAAIRAAAPKRAKVYEVHHTVEHARQRYFAALIDGRTPAECEAAALD